MRTSKSGEKYIETYPLSYKVVLPSPVGGKQTKVFHVDSYAGDKRAALIAAVRYRDSLLATAPSKESGTPALATVIDDKPVKTPKPAEKPIGKPKAEKPKAGSGTPAPASPYKHITRKVRSWVVAFGSNRAVFSDRSYGGTEGALQAALAARKEMYKAKTEITATKPKLQAGVPSAAEINAAIDRLYYATYGSVDFTRVPTEFVKDCWFLAKLFMEEKRAKPIEDVSFNL